MRAVLWGTALLALAALIIGIYLTGQQEAPVRAAISVDEAMRSDTVGYSRVTAPRPFSFPDDHGPHPAYKTEWWYLTGNLLTDGGRRFGYQFTIFRSALVPPDSSRKRRSAWAADQLYMAHFTVSDIESGQFYAFERFSRGAAGLAGGQTRPLQVWVEDWMIEQAGEKSPPIRLEARQDGIALSLVLEAAKPVVLQGDQGYDRKGPRPGDASYYYSFTRLKTAGKVTVAGQGYEVEGLSWMDREWSTSALGEDQVGWDWFSLQLDDGRELMYYQIREHDGGISPYSDGVIVEQDGQTHRLAAADVQLSVLDHWQSPRSGAVYPARWRLQVPEENLVLEVEPYLEDQELDVSVRYWEGAVRVSGRAAGRPVEGSGYVELTGYDRESAALTR